MKADRRERWFIRWWREVAALLSLAAAIAAACFACDANNISREANRTSRDALTEAQRANEIADEDLRQSAALPKVDSSVVIHGDCESDEAITIDVTLRNDGRLPTNASGVELVVDYERETTFGEYLGGKSTYKDEVLTANPLDAEVPGQGSNTLPLVVDCDNLGFLVAGLGIDSAAQVANFIGGKAVSAGSVNSSLWTIKGLMSVKVDFGKGGPSKTRLTSATIR